MEAGAGGDGLRSARGDFFFFFFLKIDFADFSMYPLKNEGGLIFEVTLYLGQYGSSG